MEVETSLQKVRSLINKPSNRMTIICGECSQAISPQKERAKCAECKNDLHLNSKCSGLQANSWRCKGANGQASWVCPTCRNKTGLASHQASPRNSFDEGITTETDNNPKKRRLSNCEEVDLGNGNKSELAIMIAVELEKALGNFLITLNETLDEKLNIHKAYIKEQVKELQEENRILKDKIEDLEQYSRRNNLVIDGVTEITNENRIETAVRAAKMVGFDLHPSQIDDCHRLPLRAGNYQNPNRPRPFIIRFVNRHFKRELLIHSKKNKSDRIFVNEHLTPRTVELKKTAKKMLGVLGFGIDTRDCIVHAIKKDHKPVRLYSIQQIEELAKKYHLNENVIEQESQARS